MVFSSSSIGLEINSTGVVSALVSGSVASPRVERIAHATFAPNTLRPSLRERNIFDSVAFTEGIQSACNQLLSKSQRVTVSLPDVVSHIMLVDFEGRFKSRSEALDLIRWKLKKSIPIDAADTHLDYQQLAVRDNGDLALMVAITSRSVISQYEDAIVAAGFVPERIDCNTLSLCRLFDRRFTLQDNCVLVSFFGNTLSVVAFTEGVPEFIRSKDLTGTMATDSRVFMEINSSLLVYRERFPERLIQSVFCIAAPDVTTAFLDMVAEATAATPAMLEVKGLVTPGNYAPGDQVRLFPCSAAIGVAVRNS
jgi:type IV pilus assembly protein PilM